MKQALLELALRRPRLIYLATLLLVVVLGLQIPRIQVDTDPENMLPAGQADRMFHNEVRAEMALHDAIVVGLVETAHPDGIYNPASLGALHRATERILELEGVVARDLMALSVADNIDQAGPGTVRFEWLMPEPPQTREASLALRGHVERLPLLEDTLASGDGRAAAIYVPIHDKNESHRLSREIEAITAAASQEFGATGAWHITGLPVAEDTFGYEMFIQMGISAPLAGLAIFLLLWLFFRSVPLIVAPMIVAMVTVIATMGLLIGMGFTVHIMSSMIPIFLMPIAVVDSVHIMSEFADRFRPGRDRNETIREVVGHLFRPMLFTSVTSSVGFASLALTPIPPVQVFGAFVAFGIMLAFLLTIVFIPAWVSRMKPENLAKTQAVLHRREGDSMLSRLVRATGVGALARSRLLLVAFAVVFAVSIAGIAQIQINDNPTRWFKSDHRIRVADRVLNEHFAGTYDAWLVLDRTAETMSAEEFNELISELEDRLFEAEGDEYAALEAELAQVEAAASEARYFQQPEILRWIAHLQADLAASGLVGKSNALPDLVKTVTRELVSGEAADFRIPDSVAGVAQALLQFQSSHRPQDLWHMVTPDYSRAVVWLQLTSGDNQDMSAVRQHVDGYLAAQPPPDGMAVRWAGKTYLNVVWQDAMVRGMVGSLAGAFVAVLIMMVVLFRSIGYGLLAMLPLTVTITFIYGLIGWTGKDYDMPIAVLSALTLGLSIDFAIHFIERSREALARHGDFHAAMADVFEEPARAISRNAIVIAVGFTPLLLAPLVPYITVGIFLATIMAVSAIVTLVLLPAVMQPFLGRGLEPAAVQS
ncbi:MAG TPA: MMPL family transporter [Gammaproteobacteria bacterium]|nr:MMPL family transporter [Gammaproteobacteria bacterium]